MNVEYWALGISLTLLLAGFTLVYKIGKWQGKVDTDRKNFKEFMTEIRNKLDDIFIRLPATPINQGSPIRLTDLGERISNDINAEEWAEALANEMFEDTKGLDAFEIQEKSFEKAKNFKPDESLLKRCIPLHLKKV